MKKRAKYTERKSFRLSPQEAYRLDQSGYSPREAIEYFNKTFCSTEPRGLKIELILLEETLKEQKLEVAKTKENIRIIKEKIENKEQTRFNRSESDEILEILNRPPLSENECLDKIRNYMKTMKTNTGVKTIDQVPNDYLKAVAKQGDIELDYLKKIAFEKLK
jgi:hypothetical protein